MQDADQPADALGDLPSQVPVVRQLAEVSSWFAESVARSSCSRSASLWSNRVRTPIAGVQ